MTKATGKRGKNLCKKAYRWTQTKKVLCQGSAALGKSEKIHSGYKWKKSSGQETACAASRKREG